jgi:outer membrane protein assembly factor BamA
MGSLNNRHSFIGPKTNAVILSEGECPSRRTPATQASLNSAPRNSGDRLRPVFHNRQIMRKLAVVLLLVSALLSAIEAAAQANKPPLRVLPKKFLLTSINVIGSELHSQQEIITASGLKLNTEVSQQDLENASNRLGESGAFSSVQYRYAPNAPNQVTAQFQVVDNAPWLPVMFDNLVWFSREQIIEQLHQRFPLFKGNLPQTGTLAEQVRAGLEQMVGQRGVQARVVTELRAEGGKAVDAIVFRAVGTKVKIAAVEWKGVQQIDAAVLAYAVKPLVGSDYKQSYVRGFMSGTLRPLYLERGFLQVAFAEHQVEVKSTTPAETQVAITVPVEEGPTYKFRGVEWSGNTLLPAAELDKLVKLKPGDTANSVLLEQELADVRKFYGRRGRMAMELSVHPRLNEDQTADFAVRIDEGEAYGMGEVELRGLDPRMTHQLLALWKLPRGATYDELYPDEFGFSVMHLLSRRRLQYRKQETIDEQAKRVDVVLEFTQQPLR